MQKQKSIFNLSGFQQLHIRMALFSLLGVAWFLLIFHSEQHIYRRADIIRPHHMKLDKFSGYVLYILTACG